ncbi:MULTISPECIES: hypothetical protein [Gordonia]|uniref:ABC transporter substrate-binding protein n=1 Tax=Gordonia malaquae NBRC 108250 TaxID=1223542 RepID=M3UGS3_GORML|nr:hypothetical protein [Gordonia malaquae]GAC78500.1 hypothetical protein GM1_003_02390 [Gordonia malaquae NBRC 108250]
MSKHSTGEKNRQFIARPIVAGALVVILIAGVITAWSRLGDDIEQTASTDASACVDGKATVPVVADPAIAPGLQRIAQNFNSTNPIVRDKCVTVQVRPADARATLEGLTAKKWDTRSFGPYPGAWVPESSVWAAALQTKNESILQGPPASLVSSPVRLVIERELAKAINGRIAWKDLPGLTQANSLAAYGHREWGSLRMAMPNGPQSDASALGAQGVAAAVADQKGSLTAAQAESPAVKRAVEQLMSAPPKIGDGSTAAAVTAIGAATDPANAKVRAVPATEQSVFASTVDDKTAKVAVVAPTGATPVADYPVVKLAGDMVPAYAGDAISEFFTFARKPPQMKILTGMGFRGTGPLPAPTATVPFGPVVDALPAPEPAAAVAINKIVLPAAAP